MIRSLAAFALLALAFPAGSLAAPAPGSSAVVEAVQSPAWLDRGGRSLAVSPGMRLSNRDQLRTGANARLLLRMPDGSAVKLGEQARFRIDVQRRQGQLYSAAMNVLEGAFRFTTELLGRYRGKRDVRIQFPTVTAGIRGTDVWGKSAEDREVVCLIEGRVEIERGAESRLVMDRAGSFYVAPRGRPSEPVAPVEPEQLKIWAAETEIQSGHGALRRGGSWKVSLASFDSQADARALQEALQEAGYSAQIGRERADRATLYQVQMGQLPSEEDARALADALRGKYGVTQPRVSR
jgi:hypothetical protein